MSDVIWVALITGGVAIAGNVAAYVIAKTTTTSNVRTAREASRVELAKVESENVRLRNSWREAERQNRQGTYHQALGHLAAVDVMLISGVGLTAEAFDAWVLRWGFLSGGIELFGSEAVKKTLPGVQYAVAIIRTAAKAAIKAPEPYEAAMLLLAKDGRQRLVVAQGALTEAMRDDIIGGHGDA